MTAKPSRIRRAPHDKENPYFQMRRESAQNRNLSWEARGVLAYLLSQSDDWVVQIKDLQQAKCGRDKVYRILDELKQAGYVQRERKQVEHGRFEWGDYLVSELPFPENPYTEKPDTVEPYTENTELNKYKGLKTTKRERKPRTPSKKKEGLTELEQWQVRLRTVTVIMPAILSKMERGYDLKMNKPEEYLTEALLKKYVPLAEQLTFLKMTPTQFFGLWGEIEPEYRRNGWTIGITTIEHKSPSYMLRQNKKTEAQLPPLTVVTSQPAQPAEPELTAEQRIALAEQTRIDYLKRPAVGE